MRKFSKETDFIRIDLQFSVFSLRITPSEDTRAEDDSFNPHSSAGTAILDVFFLSFFEIFQEPLGKSLEAQTLC